MAIDFTMEITAESLRHLAYATSNLLEHLAMTETEIRQASRAGQQAGRHPLRASGRLRYSVEMIRDCVGLRREALRTVRVKELLLKCRAVTEWTHEQVIDELNRFSGTVEQFYEYLLANGLPHRQNAGRASTSDNVTIEMLRPPAPSELMERMRDEMITRMAIPSFPARNGSPPVYPTESPDLSVAMPVESCPKCDGKVQTLGREAHYCLDCDWDNLTELQPPRTGPEIEHGIDITGESVHYSSMAEWEANQQRILLEEAFCAVYRPLVEEPESDEPPRLP